MNLKNLSSQEVLILRRIDAHTQPKNDADLHGWIKSYLGMHVPRRAVCDGHDAPFMLIADPFFGRRMHLIGFASRLGGKTTNIAILHHLNSLFKPGCETASLGAIQAQAYKCYGYIHDFLEIPWFADDAIWRTMRETKYNNGSSIAILSGTECGVNSPHPHSAAIDEVELMRWDLLQEAFSMVKSDPGIPATQILTSTRKRLHGTMQKLLDRVFDDPDFPFKIVKWCVFEAIKRCKEISCDKCKCLVRGDGLSFFDICQGKAKEADGFIPLEDVHIKFKTLDPDVFDAQWLGLKPHRKGLVFAEFDLDVHVRSDIVYHPKWRTAAGVDFGFTEPFCCVLYQMDEQGNLYQLNELYGSKVSMPDWITMMKDWRDPVTREKYEIPAFYCDSSEPGLIREMINAGLPALSTPCGIVEGDRAHRRYLTGHITGEPTIAIHPRCRMTIAEYDRYHNKVDPDGVVRSEIPDPRSENHTKDPQRYLLKGWGLVDRVGQVVVYRSDRPVRRNIRVPTSDKWMRNRPASRGFPLRRGAQEPEEQPVRFPFTEE